ncbi:shikimate dehydrogenase [Thermosulfurimonas marina]|uniref:Shikimate dehydrogenase (NADP(+)) n=1 Tax=Thermosulfurimonas marina TaxID=2047767 RepID=A0A6H1WQ54_9BACT|nr:shikimate dehydrogenase [Thermosulfurimonas marina]QJA05321.1 shikimate dehydrogenase [Thermosulfurimonas marina]
MRVLGVLGYPVAHSLSPAMHNAALRALGIPAVYGAFEVPPDLLPQAMVGVRALGIGGLSVTIPHKETVMLYLEEIDPVARKIGAVNTVVNREGRLWGTNTDWIGVKRSLEEAGLNLRGRRAAVVGAGGAARAVVFALREAGAEVEVYNRTLERAQALVQSLGGRAFPLSEISQASGEVIIQTTSVGLKSWESPVPKEVFHNFRAAMDLVYVPLRTRFLAEAEAAGCLTIDGLKMLVYQGAEQFRLFTGKNPPLDLMYQAALERLKKHGEEKN